MAHNYDPDGAAEISKAQLEAARALRLRVVNLMCDLPNAKVGDFGAVSALVLMPFLPRVGEQIQLQNGKRCTVTKVIWGIVDQAEPDGETTFTIATPNVYAVLDADK
ncbi:MAG: hypothetical protein Q8L55_02265 [Phycisphaerales bacterium]|nr:hypothetical protein [Phycisphaerales bacterium]